MLISDLVFFFNLVVDAFGIEWLLKVVEVKNYTFKFTPTAMA